MPYAFHEVLKTPNPVTALAFACTDTLSVGSDDGSVRLYSLPSPTVTRAIRSLGSEISSIYWTTPPADDKGDLWIASGKKIHFLQVNRPESRSKLILTSEDASLTLDTTNDDQNEVNELSVSPSKQYLAFSTDEGEVGVVDLSSPQKQTKLMKTLHTSISACVKFIPDRPSELVSGGYDSALLHFDFKQGILLSRYDIAPSEPPSMTIPFVISVSVSVTGIIVATLADGRIWVGIGGAKTSANAGKSKSKKSRKWEGLQGSMGCYTQVASGPVVGSAFTSDGFLLTCSLLGKLAQHSITHTDEKAEVKTIWTGETLNLHKVSAIAVSEKWFAIAGFGKDDRGFVEIWCPTSQSECEADIVAKAEQLSVEDTQNVKVNYSI